MSTTTQHSRTTGRSVLAVLLISLTAFVSLTDAQSLEDLWNSYVQQSSAESKKYDANIARRERNLDHWDSSTAAAYLGLHPETLKPLPQFLSESSASDATSSVVELTDEYIGHDAAILFYAQWCTNCHAVAPSWDAIASHLNAGSKSSKLVMALFDCEKNVRHMELCVEAGVKAYPTMMFVGSGEYHDTDFFTRAIWGRDNSAGPFGATTLRRTVKFQGNWQYGDQILDWVNTMRGLSSWHSIIDKGPLKNFRNSIFGLLGRSSSKMGRGKDSSSLPVGVPPGFQPQRNEIYDRHGVGGSDESLDTKLNATNKMADLYEKAYKHSNTLLDGLLFPDDVITNETDKVDIFSHLTETDGWFKNATTLPVGSSNNKHPSILRSCAAELSLDYCTRVSKRETDAYIEELSLIPDDTPFPTMDQIEQHLVDVINATEQYCAMIETCIITDYEKEECRPKKCPFENEAACYYVQNCFRAEIQNEYAIALGLSFNSTVSDEDVGGDANDVKAEKTSSVGGWGIPISN